MTTRLSIHHKCEDEGFGTLADIFDSILDRGQATEEQVGAWLDEHGCEAAWSFVDAAITQLETEVLA